MVYLDNAATTQVAPACVQTVSEVLATHFANPSSLYGIGLESQKVLERARGVLAKAMGCRPDEVIFTGSGTEANNLAVLGLARARRGWGNEIVASGYEHPSVENALRALEAEGFTVRRVMPDAAGNLDVERFVSLVGKQTVLAACMHVNNEIGARIDTAALARRVKEQNKRTAFHCDNVQGFLKHPLRLGGEIDTMSVSAHKIHGPKGIGALYIRRGLNIAKTIYGGLQEQGLRSGTENVAYAAGFAKAAELAIAQSAAALENAARISGVLRAGIGALDGVRVNSPDGASPYIFNFSLLGYRSETVLHFLESRGIYVSSGSACSRGEKSHTLTAMALPDRAVDSAVRVSLCESTTDADAAAFLEAVASAQKELVHT